MASYLSVALGSAFGGLARFGLGLLIDRRLGMRFPWATLIINLSGSFLIGLSAGAMVPGKTDPLSWIAAFWLVGFLGSYTTVSAFSMQTLQLFHRQHYLSASVNVLASVSGCVIVAMAGWVLAGGRFG